MNHERATYYASIIREQVQVPVEVKSYASDLSRIAVHLPFMVKVIDTPEQADSFLRDLNEYRYSFG